MNKKWKRVWSVSLVIIFTLIAAACGVNPTAGNKSQTEKKTVAALDNPSAMLQAETDKYLKKNKPLYIEPVEVLALMGANSEQGYVIVDIRNDDHYAYAHIPGAIHISYMDAWKEEKVRYLPQDKRIIVVDYSGHTASQVAALWGLLGLDAIAMKNGMAGWSKDKDVIGGSPLLCEAQNYPVTVVPVSAEQYELPKFSIQASSLPELIVKSSKEAGEVPPVVQPKDLKEKLASYYVIDIRQHQHYQAGHIEGAVNIPFRSIAEKENLKKIPADKNVALVCYDGHAASQAARLLNQLGYRATVLKDGMSAWSLDEKVIGDKTIACNVSENPVMKLNALLKAAPSTAAT